MESCAAGYNGDLGFLKEFAMPIYEQFNEGPTSAISPNLTRNPNIIVVHFRLFGWDASKLHRGFPLH